MYFGWAREADAVIYWMRTPVDWTDEACIHSSFHDCRSCFVSRIVCRGQNSDISRRCSVHTCWSGSVQCCPKGGRKVSLCGYRCEFNSRGEVHEPTEVSPSKVLLKQTSNKESCDVTLKDVIWCLCSSPKLRTLAKALNPAFLRFGGTKQDFMKFNPRGRYFQARENSSTPVLGKLFHLASIYELVNHILQSESWQRCVVIWL